MEDVERGLYRKYVISKVDGSVVDPEAVYFVLRLDYHDGCDIGHVYASRAGARKYAEEVLETLPVLSGDLLTVLASGPSVGWWNERQAEREEEARARGIVEEEAVERGARLLRRLRKKWEAEMWKEVESAKKGREAVKEWEELLVVVRAIRGGCVEAIELEKEDKEG